jgi:hypothetical protein
MSDKIGRIPVENLYDKHVHDGPNRTVEAMLTQQDQMIGMLQDLAAKLDADTGVTDTDYAATLTDSMQKLDLIL